MLWFAIPCSITLQMKVIVAEAMVRVIWLVICLMKEIKPSNNSDYPYSTLVIRVGGSSCSMVVIGSLSIFPLNLSSNSSNPYSITLSPSKAAAWLTLPRGTFLKSYEGLPLLALSCDGIFVPGTVSLLCLFFRCVLNAGYDPYAFPQPQIYSLSILTK